MLRKRYQVSLRRIILALFLSFLLLGAVGCAGLLGQPVPTPEPVKLLFVFSGRAQESKYQDAAKAFNLKHPHITVEVQRSSYVSRRVDSGGVDAFEAEQFEFWYLLQRKAVRDLTPILEGATDFPINDFYPKLLDVFRYEGRTWGVPANVDPLVIFYNRDLFDQMDISYPQASWNWADFLITARNLSKPLDEPRQYGFADALGGFSLWAFIYQHGGRLVDNLVQPTKATLDDPRVEEAIQWFVDLANRHQVMPSMAEGMSESLVSSAIAQGKVGMWALLLSERYERSATWPFQLGSVPFPRDRESITFFLASGYFITSGSMHPKESWLWLEYLTREADLNWDVPPRRSAAQSEKYRQRVGEEVFAIAQEVAEHGQSLPSAAWLYQVPAQSGNFVADLMSGKRPIREVLKEMQEQWNAAIQAFNQRTSQ